jgi:hypothetical protein
MFVINPTVGSRPNDSGNGTYYYIDGQYVVNTYSKGEVKISGSVTEEDGGDTGTYIANIALQAGWNSLVETETGNSSNWTLTMESKSPGSGAKWIYYPYSNE